MIIDVGAGMGSDLPLFSKAVGPSGRVIAIEAHPTTFSVMERVVARNGLDNVTCVQKAVVGEPGRVFISDETQHISNAICRSGDKPGLSVEVEGDTLDNICAGANVDRVAFLKMNIEGAERYALKGMVTMLPVTQGVCIACHDFRADRNEGEHFRTRQVVCDFLKRQGFVVSLRDSHPDKSVRDHVHARNSLLESQSF